ncbi:MAG: hypothetical protein V4489_05415 [Chlamydiota bacterium]
MLLEKLQLLNENSFFWFFALLGSGLFIIQFAITLICHGIDATDDSEGGNFKWLSKQAVIGFFMMFGWIGLTCQKEFTLAKSSSIIISLVGGVITIFLTGLIFKGARKLHSPGTVFNLDDAIGKQATIYQRIPKTGTGKISLSLNNFTHEIDAISLHPEDLDSFTSVQIIKKTDENTVLVAPIP